MLAMKEIPYTMFINRKSVKKVPKEVIAALESKKFPSEAHAWQDARVAQKLLFKSYGVHAVISIS